MRLFDLRRARRGGWQGGQVPTGSGLIVAVEKDRAARAALVAGMRRGGVARLHRRATPDEAAALIRQAGILRLLAIGIGDAAEPALDLVAECRRSFPRAVILTIDHACGPDSVARAFRAGADDVIRAPYAESELVARLARRLGEALPKDDLLAGFAAIHLSPVEARILRLLADRQGHTVGRRDLALAIGDRDWTYGDRKFDVHVARIRRKLQTVVGDRVTVHTVRSAGYRLEMDAAER